MYLSVTYIALQPDQVKSSRKQRPLPPTLTEMLNEFVGNTTPRKVPSIDPSDTDDNDDNNGGKSIMLILLQGFRFPNYEIQNYANAIYFVGNYTQINGVYVVSYFVICKLQTLLGLQFYINVHQFNLILLDIYFEVYFRIT